MLSATSTAIDLPAPPRFKGVAIGSHSPFNDWGSLLPDQPAVISLLDRLCHHAHIITTTGDSYRLTHRTTNRKEA